MNPKWPEIDDWDSLENVPLTISLKSITVGHTINCGIL